MAHGHRGGSLRSPGRSSVDVGRSSAEASSPRLQSGGPSPGPEVEESVGVKTSDGPARLLGLSCCEANKADIQAGPVSAFLDLQSVASRPTSTSPPIQIVASPRFDLPAQETEQSHSTDSALSSQTEDLQRAAPLESELLLDPEVNLEGLKASVVPPPPAPTYTCPAPQHSEQPGSPTQTRTLKVYARWHAGSGARGGVVLGTPNSLMPIDQFLRKITRAVGTLLPAPHFNKQRKKNPPPDSPPHRS